LPADGMQADVELSQRQQEAAEADSNAQLAYAQLAGVLGDPSKRFTLVAPAGVPEPLSASVDELQSRALRARPDLQAAQNEIAAAEKSVRASHEAYGPQISTFGNVEADNPHLTGGGNTNWTVGAKAEIQLFDGGERKSQVSKANAQREMAEAAYKQAVIQTGLDVKQAYYSQQTTERQYEISDEMLRKTQETLRTSLDRYNAGLVTITEVLREQEQLRYMELTRAQSLYQWWIADAQLRLATGDINVTRPGVHP
ncbi:MAG TPA: TolC family protein, partial [Acidobacteriaceae bacterium]|nr:TolC family protein [Acidobacteriaceae bacterium]